MDKEKKLRFSVITSVYKSDVPEYVRTAFESVLPMDQYQMILRLWWRISRFSIQQSCILFIWRKMVVWVRQCE